MAAAIRLREDYDAGALRRLPSARRTRRKRAGCWLSPRSTTARAKRGGENGGVGLQVIRDWVLRFNAHGPDGLVDRKAPGRLQSSMTRTAAADENDREGPTRNPWRRALANRRSLPVVFEEFRVAIAEQTMSRELRKMASASFRQAAHMRRPRARSRILKKFPTA